MVANIGKMILPIRIQVGNCDFVEVGTVELEPSVDADGHIQIQFSPFADALRAIADEIARKDDGSSTSGSQ